jgi:energy-coupling factor transport system ATP-binding protein
MKIEIKSLTYTYDNKGKKALDDVSLTLDENNITFILGHTGSGKSTLIQHFNGLLFPTSGEVSVEIDDNKYLINSKEKRIKELRKNVGMVFQFPENQLFESSVIKDVMFGPKNFGYDEIEAESLAKESLRLLNVDETYYERSPFDLSGGEKRKVAIAGVLASKPKILVLDEPTSSLDNKSTREFFKILKKLQQEGTMVIVISHDVNLCYEYADNVVILNNGKIVYSGDYKNAFTNKQILKEAYIETPFVLKVKERLKLDTDARNIKELIKKMKEVGLHE